MGNAMAEITAQTIFPQLVERLNLNVHRVQYILDQARTEKSTPFDYLVASGLVSQSDIYRALAELLGVRFRLDFAASTIVPNTARTLNMLSGIRAVRIQTGKERTLILAPDFRAVCALITTLENQPELASSTCLVSPKLMQRNLVACHSDQLSDNASWGLSRRMPHSSAYVALNSRRNLIIFVIAMLTMLALVIMPLTNGYFALFVSTVIFLVPSLLRFFALITSFINRDQHPDIRVLTDSELPTYSILVPLNNETELVPQLVTAMSDIDYPRSKIDITFVVEESSTDTLAALAAASRDTPYRIVAVPSSEPQTKPKALDFALPFVTGEYVVVFDAEDIPHPQQLRWAAAHFAANPQIDCFQAELIIDNGGQSFFSGMFAGDYAGLFGVYLPMLARHNLPLPLGGTSNHFRRQSLREIGGWDAHNVTEDADLGMRLARMRYKCSTLRPHAASETHEDAPTSFLIWLNQRTRWLKGWMITFIVHNQQPITLLRDLGLKRFLFFQFLIGSMVLSTPLHLLSVLYFATSVTLDPGYFGQLGLLTKFNLSFLLIGYISVFLVNAFGLIRRKQYGLIPMQLLQPIYWLFISFAAILAYLQIQTNPYKWAKTPHKAAKRR